MLSKAVEFALSEKRRTLSDVERRLDEFRIQVEDLETKQRLVQKDIEFYQGLVAPIRRLQSELLLQIFTFCLEAEVSGFNLNRPPLLLTHVCHSWRQLVSEYSPLWSTISIGSNPVEAAVSHWLQLSKSSPLRVEIR
ncbi:hypothetical protein M422DRAFT_176268, partial [Sphaerobolus stellatus SS14]